MRHFGVTTASDGGHDALEAAVKRVIDDSAALLVLIARLLDHQETSGAGTS